MLGGLYGEHRGRNRSVWWLLDNLWVERIWRIRCTTNCDAVAIAAGLRRLSASFVEGPFGARKKKALRLKFAR
jgi:hypothetical protein